MTKKLAVIFLENPPYFGLSTKNDLDTKYEKSYVKEQMKGIKTGFNLDEEFTWSAFNMYSIYAYIHYGPIRSWKTTHLIDKEVRKAYLCNKKYFNASEGTIALIYWTNKDKNNASIVFDSDLGKYEVKKVHNNIVSNILYRNGTKDNAIIEINSFGTMLCLERFGQTILEDVHEKQKGFYVDREHLLEQLPLFVVARDSYSLSGKDPYTNQVDYRVLDTIAKTGDGGTKYQKDTKFLQDCLLYTMCCDNHKVSSDIFYTTCESLLDDEHKNTELYKLYKQLVDETGINGLKNIQHILGRTNTDINKLKHLLSIFQYETIRPKMLEYELLK
jgi:hypothetical protein